MRLCLIAPIVLTSEAGGFRVNGNYGRLIADLAAHLESVEVVAGQAEAGDPMYYPDGKSLYSFPLPSGNVHAAVVRASTPAMPPWRKAGVWVSRILPYARAIRRADLVYIAMPGLSAMLAWLLCRLARKPYVLYYGSDWQSLAPFLTKWSGHSFWLSFYRRVVKWAEGVPVRSSLFTLATGRDLEERLRSYGPRVYETSPMVWLRPGDFRNRNDTCQSRPITVLSVGSLIPRKGIHNLVEAIALARSRGLDLTLALAGPADPDYLVRLKNLVRELSLEPQVTFAGYITDPEALLRLYRHADLFALATESEGFPRVLYEAMSQGLPVVATSIPAIAQTLRDRKEAILVRTGSPEAIAAGLEEVIRDVELRQRLIQEGRRFVEGRISDATIADQLLRLCQQYLPSDAERKS
jgi:glycosyltransferase involved in cell wall biosynthesis